MEEVRFSLRLTPELNDSAERRAKEEGISKNQYINKLIRLDSSSGSNEINIVNVNLELDKELEIYFSKDGTPTERLEQIIVEKIKDAVTDKVNRAINDTIKGFDDSYFEQLVTAYITGNKK